MLSKGVVLAFIYCLVSHFSNAQQHLEWKLQHPITKEWIDVGENAVVQEVLFKNGILPDPFADTNEKLYQWIEDYQWTFKSDFTIHLKNVENKKLELNFPSIDTYATVFLNGEELGRSENAFHPYNFSIENLVVEGNNILEVVFTPPVLYWKDSISKNAYQLPAPNDLGEFAVAPYCRKPQYHFGWDWAPRLNTIGFWKPAVISVQDEIKCSGIFYETVAANVDSAILRISINFSNKTKSPLRFNSTLLDDQILVPDKENYSFNFKLENPKFWWPMGLGEPFLYEDIVNIETINGQVIFSDTITFGVRTSQLNQSKDQWGQSFEVVINDYPIFCKGANLIPLEVFPSQVTNEAIFELVENVKKSNMNMIRVWGGGFYPDDYFYELCDKNGIMVWQDLMFACAMYPGDDHFLNNVGSELSYQIPRISKHPSVVLFNGNNEVEVAWRNWGLQETYHLNDENQLEISENYDLLFKQFIPDKIKSITNIPYVHTSPLSNWGKLSDFNFGSQHYWGLWHGNDSIEAIPLKIGRFNSEYGFQSFPEFNCISKITNQNNWYLSNENIKWHQKSYVGNAKIGEHAARLFDNPESFEEFVYLSQLTQAEIVGRSIVAHRLDYPRCMGSLYWQLNDCWPAPTWSGIDYLGNWKALQFRVKSDFEDVTILQHKDKDAFRYCISIANQRELLSAEFQFFIYSLKGKLLKKGKVEIIQQGNGKIDITEKLLIDSDQEILIKFIWKKGVDEIAERSYVQLFNNKKVLNRGDVQLKLIKNKPINKSAELIIKSDHFVSNFWVFSTKEGVHFDRNFIDLLPGKHRIKITYDNVPKLEDFQVMWMQ